MIFKKIDFTETAAHGVIISLVEYLPANYHPGWVPVYRFKIMNPEREVVGKIEFRAGITEFLTERDGHIGYRVYEEHRGNRYSLKAMKAILPFVWQHPLAEIVLTTDLDNEASAAIIEALGAKWKYENTFAAKDVYVFRKENSLE